MDADQMNSALRDLCEFLWVDVGSEQACLQVVAKATSLFDCHATSIGDGKWHIEATPKKINLAPA